MKVSSKKSSPSLKALPALNAMVCGASATLVSGPAPACPAPPAVAPAWPAWLDAPLLPPVPGAPEDAPIPADAPEPPPGDAVPALPEQETTHEQPGVARRKCASGASS